MYVHTEKSFRAKKYKISFFKFFLNVEEIQRDKRIYSLTSYVYVCTYSTYLCMYVFMFVSIYIRLYTYVRICTNVCTYVHMYVRMYPTLLQTHEEDLQIPSPKR